MIEPKNIPSIHVLLNTTRIIALQETYPRSFIRDILRKIVAEIRSNPRDYSPSDLEPEHLAAMAEKALNKQTEPSLQKVINATGTILHTNLGRAPLCREAIDAVVSVSEGYSNLEMNIESGKRGQRADHVKKILCRLTGAEDAFVVNNNAAAVLLTLTALARGKEVIVSRGELIEIGGKFRIPDVMEAGGAILKEVGTTNRTHLSDYKQAITENTAILMKAHQSNFSIVGFTHEVSLNDLCNLATDNGIISYYDLGSGNLIAGTDFISNAPRVDECLRSGVDILTFSGDKLLGGPQAGIILGKADLIESVSTHPLARALRVDKMTLAGLEATLNLYFHPDTLSEKLPTLRMIQLPLPELKRRAKRLVQKLRKSEKTKLQAQIIPEESTIGGGALPLKKIPTWAISIRHPDQPTQTIANRLRQYTPPVICRIKDDGIILDLRTVSGSDDLKILQALISLQ